MVDKRNTIKVFVAARSAPLRQRLLRLCNELPSIRLVGIMGDHLPVPRKLTELDPDLLLLDVEPRTRYATDLFSEIAQHLPRCRTIVLSKNDAAGAHLPPAGTRAALIDPDDHNGLRDAIRQSLRDRSAQAGSALTPTVPLRPPPPEDGESGRHAVAPRDRRRQEEGRRLLERERSGTDARLQSLMERLPGVPYVAPLDINAGGMYVSPRIREVLGCTCREWCTEPELRTRVIHPEDRERVIAEMNRAVATGGYCIDYRILRTDGQVRWLHDEAHVVSDARGTTQCIQGAILDITERKQAQEELDRLHDQLEDLIATIDTARSGEQKRLAQEMHDDFGQLLAAMKIDLCVLQRHLPQENADALRSLADIQELVDAMMNSVRRILAGLPPAALHDMPLDEALESLVTGFRKRYLAQCRLIIAADCQSFDAGLSAVLFRITQEALNNVAKHAQATEVEIRLAMEGGVLTVAVVDNGKGMPPESARRHGSFGLVFMRERVTALGGRIHLTSRPGHGTAISIEVPLGGAGMKTRN